MSEEARFGLEEFELYQSARAFRREVYAVIKQLPAVERHCLDPQMRRAAVSVSNNIAEGHGRWHYRENIQFCRVSRGSVEEIMDDLNVCLDENYATPETVTALHAQAQKLIHRISAYIAYLRKTKQGAGSP